MKTVTLRKEVSEELARIGHADIVVGIPSFNSEKTIGHVVRAVQAGLAKYFPDRKAVLVNSDGGSKDGTMDVVRNTRIEDQEAIMLHHRIEPVPTIATPYEGIPGKGSAFRTVFEIADALEAKACAVFDSDLRSITPEWIELLIKPVLTGGTDFVAPLYHRHKFDGTITNSIVYPLTRALYGKRARQPIGGDFGFSGRLAAFFLSKDVWESDVARFGIDIWMTTEAIANGFKISQSFLGAKIHDPKDPGADLSAMLYQVVGATFGLMETYAGVWDLRELWREALGAGDLGEVEMQAGRPDSEFRFPLRLWTRIVYDYALAYHRRKFPQEHLLKSLTPLYLGKTASFVMEAADLGQDEAEGEIEKRCLEFEQNKDHLVNNWN